MSITASFPTTSPSPINEQPIELFQGPRVWGIPNASPFCIKLELFLRAFRIPYASRPFNPTMAPRGKMPFIKDGSQLISDSETIIAYLCRKHNIQLDSHLKEEHIQLTQCIRRMLEEGTYFIILSNRWLDATNWPKVKQDYFSFMPPMVRNVIPEILRRQIKRTAHGQGVYRYSEGEISATLQRDLASVAYFMHETGPFMLGDRISSLDFTVFATLISLLKAQIPKPITCKALESAKLKKYVDFIMNKYFDPSENA